MFGVTVTVSFFERIEAFSGCAMLLREIKFLTDRRRLPQATQTSAGLGARSGCD